MSKINRIEADEFWADSTIIEAGDYVFVGYCMGNEGKSIEDQIHGAIDVLEKPFENGWFNIGICRKNGLPIQRYQ